jgi:hypothetical protein
VNSQIRPPFKQGPLNLRREKSAAFQFPKRQIGPLISFSAHDMNLNLKAWMNFLQGQNRLMGLC